MSETHSEELEYELGLRGETIEQLKQQIEDLTALEKFQALKEFEDSTTFDSYRGSQGELRALFQKEEAKARIFRERAACAEEEQALMREKLQAMEKELSKLTVTNRQLQADLQNETKRREESNKQAKSLREKVDSLRRSSPQKEKDTQAQQQLAEANKTISELENTVAEHQDTIESQKSMIERLSRQLQEHKEELASSYRTIEEQETVIRAHDEEISRIRDECDARVDQIETKFRQSDMVRRQLHNQVMELKGNIRVFCRVRPVLANERAFGRQVPEVYMFPDYEKEKRRVVLVADSKTHKSYSISNQEGNKKWPFEFDQVFNWNATQVEMFQEVAALVQSAIDGYNVSIFAYGQTGSGKTYTMQGDENALAEHNPSQWSEIPDLGIVGRTMSHLFATCAKQMDHGWAYDISFDMYEIYNETIRDLLAGPSSSMRDNLTAQVDSNGVVQVLNLTTVRVEDEHHAMELLKQANSRRAVKKTNRNDVSSRSHCITTLKLTGHHAKSQSVRKGAVYLVDLAGSERLKSSGSGEDPIKLKEAQNINKSLSALGNVVSALATKKTHVPFRDSKLTYVLQNSLGRDSKTLMICTLSPLEEHREESLNTLRFAKKVNSCELAVPHK